VDLNMSIPAVCLHHVSFCYPGSDFPAVEKVNLDVEPGEILCFVGPNGGGKTTLLRLIMGDLRPTSGEVKLFGKSPAKFRDRLGYVPQHAAFDPRFPISALEVVLTARARLGWFRQADRQAAESALEKAGVADLAGRPFSDLSGGQRQRVLVARSLARNPRLLLLDEPTANIDPGNAGKLYESLKNLSEEVTCIMVSHDMEFVSSLARRVACVHRNLEIHPTEEFSETHAEALFGAPVRRVIHEQHLPEPQHRHD